MRRMCIGYGTVIPVGTVPADRGNETVPMSRTTPYGAESWVHTCYQRARDAGEAVRVVLTNIGPFDPEWTVGPNIGALALPLEVARRWVAEADGGLAEVGEGFRDVMLNPCRVGAASLR
jgi:hypothetical protein